MLEWVTMASCSEYSRLSTLSGVPIGAFMNTDVNIIVTYFPTEPDTPSSKSNTFEFEAIQINQNNIFLLDLASTVCRASSSSMPYNEVFRTPQWCVFQGF
jgi:hypothetical protein